MVRYEVQVSLAVRSYVLHEVLYLNLYVLKPALYKFVQHPRRSLLRVGSVLLADTVVVSSFSLELHYFSFLMETEYEFLEHVYYEHREFPSVHRHVDELPIVHSVR